MLVYHETIAMQQNKWCIARDWLLRETDRVREPSI